MDVDQIKRFLSPGSDNLIVMRVGMRALKLRNKLYFKALPVWKYAADPGHQKAFLLSFTRGFLMHSNISKYLICSYIVVMNVMEVCYGKYKFNAW
jgi:hypothetical protein